MYEDSKFFGIQIRLYLKLKVTDNVFYLLVVKLTVHIIDAYFVLRTNMDSGQ